MTQQNENSALALSLFLIRLGVFLVFFMWTIDKFLNPEHTMRVFAFYYKISWLTENLSYIVGAVQMALILAFVAGAWKKYSYMTVFILHFISTASTYPRLFDPWSDTNLLFYASIPMLAGCWALWAVRDLDTMFSWDAKRAG